MAFAFCGKSAVGPMGTAGPTIARPVPNLPEGRPGVIALTGGGIDPPFHPRNCTTRFQEGNTCFNPIWRFDFQ